jgi:hypothetical protein
MENEFFRLLREADPGTSERDPLVREFATHLATLTDDWATGSPYLSERERWLDDWVKQSTAEMGGAATSAARDEPELLLAYSSEDEPALAEADAEADTDASY